MIATNWGYDLLEVSALPDILTVDEFNTMTANKFALDSRVASTLKSVTASIRNYCGWHIANSQRCRLVINAKDLHITRKYSDLLIQLPYKYISDNLRWGYCICSSRLLRRRYKRHNRRCFG